MTVFDEVLLKVIISQSCRHGENTRPNANRASSLPPACILPLCVYSSFSSFHASSPSLSLYVFICLSLFLSVSLLLSDSVRLSLLPSLFLPLFSLHIFPDRVPLILLPSFCFLILFPFAHNLSLVVLPLFLLLILSPYLPFDLILLLLLPSFPCVPILPAEAIWLNLSGSDYLARSMAQTRLARYRLIIKAVKFRVGWPNGGLEPDLTNHLQVSSRLYTTWISRHRRFRTRREHFHPPELWECLTKCFSGFSGTR